MSNDLNEKQASFRDALASMPGQFGQAAAQGAAAGAVGAGIGLMGVAASKLYDAATKSRDFRHMLEANPDLHEYQTHSPKGFNQMYTSLRNMNPEFARDPLVAGEYMRRMTNEPMRAGGYLTEAVGHRDRFPSPVMDTYLKGGVEGLKGGARPPVGRSVKSRPMPPGSPRWEEQDLGFAGRPSPNQ